MRRRIKQERLLPPTAQRASMAEQRLNEDQLGFHYGNVVWWCFVHGYNNWVKRTSTQVLQ